MIRLSRSVCGLLFFTVVFAHHEVSAQTPLGYFSQPHPILEDTNLDAHSPWVSEDRLRLYFSGGDSSAVRSIALISTLPIEPMWMTSSPTRCG